MEARERGYEERGFGAVLLSSLVSPKVVFVSSPSPLREFSSVHTDTVIVYVAVPEYL